MLLLVASETGHVYTFATPKLQPLITKPEGKNLIQACLNAPDLSATDFASSVPLFHRDDSDICRIRPATTSKRMWQVRIEVVVCHLAVVYPLHPTLLQWPI